MFGFLFHGEPLLLYILFLILITFGPAIVLIGFVYGLTKLLTEAKMAKDFLPTDKSPSQLNEFAGMTNLKKGCKK